MQLHIVALSTENEARDAILAQTRSDTSVSNYASMTFSSNANDTGRYDTSLHWNMYLNPNLNNAFVVSTWT